MPFPIGTAQTFATYFAPADFNESVNTLGQPLYAKQEPRKSVAPICTPSPTPCLCAVTPPARRPGQGDGVTGDWQVAADGLLNACRDAFGVPVVYTPVGGEAVTIIAIFDDHAEIVTIAANGLPVSTSQTALDVRLADLTVAPQDGDGVMVDDSNFRVADVQPDGLGGARLLLHRFSPGP